jgi:hypothetical protein
VIWKHRGINRAFIDAEPAVRAAAAESHADLDIYREAINTAFFPIARQLHSNPHDAVFADVQRIKHSSGLAWYVAYSEFDGWLMIYEVQGDTSHIRGIGRWSEGRIQNLLMDE